MSFSIAGLTTKDSNVLRTQMQPLKKGETCEDIQRAVKVAKIAVQHLANLCKRFVSFTQTFNYSRDVGYIPYDINRNESRHGIHHNRT